MICSNCGNEINEDLKKCPSCGINLTIEPKPGEPAPFFIRFAAFWLDTFIISFTSWTLFVIAHYSSYSALQKKVEFIFFYTEPKVWTYFPYLSVLGLVYFVFFHAWIGQTPAKYIFRLKVVKNSGTPIMYLQALLRWLGYWLDMFSIFAGFFLGGLKFTKYRALHDLVAGTKVIFSGDLPEKEEIKAKRAFKIFGAFIVILLLSVLVPSITYRVGIYMDVRKAMIITESVDELREAVKAYQVTNGKYPDTLDMLIPDFIDEIPLLDLGIPEHPPTREVRIYEYYPEGEYGTWGYNRETGKVIIFCDDHVIGGYTPLEMTRDIEYNVSQKLDQ